MDQEIQPQNLQTSKLPKFLTTVTPLSKFLAGILFIILPFVGFYLGMRYERLTLEVSMKSNGKPFPITTSQYPKISPDISASIPVISQKTAISKDECHENDKYLVVVDNQTGNFLIKTKASIDQKFDCKYIKNEQDYEIPNGAADWFYSLNNNFLFIDSGTGPPPREMTVYDLNKRQSIFSTGYSGPVNIDNNNFDYWEGTNVKVTNTNCPDKNSWESEGLGTAMEEHFRFDLRSLKKSSLNQTRCSPRQ